MKVCEHVHTYFEPKGPHLGEYCQFCGRWLRWVKQTQTGTELTLPSPTDEGDPDVASPESIEEESIDA